MKYARNTRGALELGLAIAITMILMGLALTPAIIQDLLDVKNGRWSSSGDASYGSAAQAVRIPYVGPALPTDEQQAACVVRIAGQNGLTWAGQGRGWRSPNLYPEPELSGDSATDRGRVAVWLEGIQGYVQATAAKWQSCTETPGSTTTTAPPEEAPEIPGTYQLTYGDTSPECTRPPEQIRVTSSGASVTLTGSFGTITSPLTSDYAFDGSVPSDIGAGVRLRGRFSRFGSQTLIRNGILELQVGGGCEISFDGERVGS